jgi:aminoglycoside phosphotransferase (APT) family kinase protein
LLRTWRLEGGVSAQVMAIEIALPDGQTRKLIVRQHGEADLKRNPNIATVQFRLLQILQSSGISTSAPYYVDQTAVIFATPCLVLEYIEGVPEFAPADVADFVRQAATHLAAIHRVNASVHDLSFLPNHTSSITRKLGERPEKLDDSLDEGLIRDKLEAVWPLSQRNDTVLVHGDFWPGNLLWKAGQLVGIVDWEDAALGDPLADVGNTRLEILWAFGTEAMKRFTEHYQSLMTAVDFSNLPYWDLCAALRAAFKIAEWAGDDAKERKMRERHQWFVSKAFEKIDVL